jgi:hypothetical protein
MMNEESAPAENQTFTASFPSDMSLGQKVLLTVFFAWAETFRSIGAPLTSAPLELPSTSGTAHEGRG